MAYLQHFLICSLALLQVNAQTDCQLLGNAIYGYPISQICTGETATGRSVLIDMYESSDTNTCGCTAVVSSPSGVTSLSLANFENLQPPSSCGSSISIDVTSGGRFQGQCDAMVGEVSVVDGDVITINLNRPPNTESRYCLSLTLAAASSTLSVTCPKAATTTTTTTPNPTTTPKPTTTTANPTTTTPKPTTTTPKPTTTTPTPTTTTPKPNTTTPKPTTTTANPTTTTPKPTTTTPKPTTTTPKPTTTTHKPTTTTPKPTTTTPKPTTTTHKPTTTTPKPTTTTHKPTTITTKPTTTTAKPTTTTPKPNTTTPKPAITTPKPITTPTTTPPKSTLRTLRPLPTIGSTSPVPPTTTTTTTELTSTTIRLSSSSDSRSGSDEVVDDFERNEHNLKIIIPTVTGAFLLLVLLIICCSCCTRNDEKRAEKQRPLIKSEGKHPVGGLNRAKHTGLTGYGQDNGQYNKGMTENVLFDNSEDFPTDSGTVLVKSDPEIITSFASVERLYSAGKVAPDQQHQAEESSPVANAEEPEVSDKNEANVDVENIEDNNTTVIIERDSTAAVGNASYYSESTFDSSQSAADEDEHIAIDPETPLYAIVNKRPSEKHITYLNI